MNSEVCPKCGCTTVLFATPVSKPEYFYCGSWKCRHKWKPDGDRFEDKIIQRDFRQETQ